MMTESPLCACLDADARACYDLRYYGYTPVLRGPQHYDVVDESVWRNVDPSDDGECDCFCHEYDEDWDDDDVTL